MSSGLQKLNGNSKMSEWAARIAECRSCDPQRCRWCYGGDGSADNEIMLRDFAETDRVYIACSYTDLRFGIDGLAAVVRQQFELDPFSNTLFLFCGRRRDRIKALYWEGNGVVLLYKRLESGSSSGPAKKAKPEP